MRNVSSPPWFVWVVVGFATAVLTFGIEQVLTWVVQAGVILWVIGWAFIYIGSRFH